MIHCTVVVSLKFRSFLILSGTAALMAACDPNVVIGAKLSLGQAGLGGDPSSGGTVSAGGGGIGAVAGTGGTEIVIAGGPAAGDGGAPSAGAGGAPPVVEEWCATAPWLNTPVQFTGDSGNILAAGSYVISYVSGAQIHDLDLGYEVTGHYFTKTVPEAGHHIFSGESPETGATSLWLDDVGLVGFGASGTVTEVEEANRGHTWPLEHAGGELYVTLYDDDFRDNSGPGSRFCVAAAAP